MAAMFRRAAISITENIKGVFKPVLLYSVTNITRALAKARDFPMPLSIALPKANFLNPPTSTSLVFSMKPLKGPSQQLALTCLIPSMV